MLSILIPSYNYNTVPLVKNLAVQCTNAAVVFEIICQDDASNSPINAENYKINDIENCRFYSNSVNLGRGENRNSLVQKATYDWLLFLDCDTLPLDAHFIERYLKEKSTSDVIFGGITYENDKPQKKQVLRWVYGKNREALLVDKRNKKPNATALISNLFIKKELFLKNLFDREITTYGYEDFLFFANLEAKKIVVKHLENPVVHLGLETSFVFVEKTKQAIKNLVYIHQNYPDKVSQNSIIKAFTTLKKIRLVGCYRFFWKQSKFVFEKNLQSEHPSLFLFDLYKLGLFCNSKN